MPHALRPAPIFAIAAACTLHQGPAAAADAAQAYPSRPVRLIIAQTTGSSVDTLSRVLAAKLGEELGQQIVADNRGGAGGTIGAEIAAHAVPDGHTLLATSTGVQVISPQIYMKLNYHPVKDFAQISLFAVTQNVLVTNPGLPLNSVKELIAYAKANPGKLNMANAGSGFQSHLAGVLFTHMTGIDVLHVPYKGGASLMAVMSNEAQFTIAPGPADCGTWFVVRGTWFVTSDCQSYYNGIAAALTGLAMTGGVGSSQLRITSHDPRATYHELRTTNNEHRDWRGPAAIRV